MQWTNGRDLSPAAREEVLRRFVHRMTHENVHARPDFARYMFETGYRRPLVSDEQWLANYRFATRKDGTLTIMHTHCLPEILFT